MAARALSEYFQNQQGSVVDRQLKVPLKVALLGRAQGLVKQHLSRAHLLSQHFDLISLAAADEKRGIWRTALAGHALCRLKACRLSEQTQFVQFAVEIGKAQVNTNQYGQWLGSQASGTQLAGLSSGLAAAKLTARPGTMVEIACL